MSMVGMSVGMSVVMMLAMMTPTLAFTLWRGRLGWSTAMIGGCLLVWSVIGAAMYPLGVAVAHIAPITIIAIAVVVQFLVWQRPRKTRADGSTWSYGLRLGLDCAWSCSGFMLVWLVVGMTDLRAMAIITAAITVQHIASHHVRQPNVNEYAATPASKNSIRSIRS